MNGQELLDKMELADARYVEQADRPGRAQGRRAWPLWCAAAACLALVLTLGLRQRGPQLPVQPESVSPPPSESQGPAEPQPPALPPYPQALVLPQPGGELPVLELTAEEYSGMGYEGYSAQSADELSTGNPWTPELGLTELPVYRNAQLYTPEQRPITPDFDAMEQLLLAAAARLGYAPEELTLSDDSSTEAEKQAIRAKYREAGEEPPPDSFFAPTMLYAEGEGVRLRADSSMTVRIEFTPAVPLPEELTFPSAACSREEAEKLAAYLSEQYAGLLDMEKPTAALLGGGRDSEGRQYWSIELWDAAGTAAEQILRYNFHRVRFCLDDSGALFLIWLDRRDLTQPLGSYPLQPEPQAREALLRGDYVTSVPYSGFDAQAVQRVELVYRCETYDPLFVPYYRYYVDVTDLSGPPEEAAAPLREFGLYYVPAVDPAYLTGLPLWDGHSN